MNNKTNEYIPMNKKFQERHSNRKLKQISDYIKVKICFSM